MLNWLNTYRRYACDINRINQEARNNPEDFVLTAEKIFQNDIKLIVDRIMNIPVRRHIVFLSGPSSSGKTTSGKKLQEFFEQKGCHTILISMDDFYLGADKVRKFPDGKPDFESVEALDIPLMHHCVELIAKTGACDIPIYDFTHSRRSERTRHIRLENDSVIIIEGIHALNPIFDGSVPREYLSKIYVSVKQGIKDIEDPVLTNREVRCIRRIVRDSSFRRTDPERTLTMWDEVVDGEKKYIRPYRYSSDFTLNTIHIYEPCIMRERVLNLLSVIGSDSPVFQQAQRLMQSLERFVSIDSSLVPENSLIREFIGGGCYTY